MPRPSRLDLAWAAAVGATLVVMLGRPGWETIPVHVVWVSVTLLYALHIRRLSSAAALMIVVAGVASGAAFADVSEGLRLWGEGYETPLVSALLLGIAWHAGRRQQALEARTRLAERHQRFIHDASHELRAPVTIARGHLELVQGSEPTPEIDVALEELARIETIVNRLLLLAEAAEPDFFVASDVELHEFLEDVFMRWAGTAQRAWRLGRLARGTLRVDPEALRAALDALLENAVRYTEPAQVVALRSRAEGDAIVIDVVDHGCGIDAESIDRIFERFARADSTRDHGDGGGAGL
ncbi:MAG TPA: HAMP domain-containing sensor histidine kinase, partial [Gaiellaceae bacterium]|nr:HAMP domain-containing sensor histidine kinase [Gaiellaceae bacterium]